MIPRVRVHRHPEPLYGLWGAEWWWVVSVGFERVLMVRRWADAFALARVIARQNASTTTTSSGTHGVTAQRSE